MKRTFTIENGQPDIDGNIININGIHIPDKLPVLVNWDCQNFIGNATVVKENNELKATFNVDDRYLDAYPGIWFSVIKYHSNGTGKIFDEIKLYALSLCNATFYKSKIKTIREQTT